MVINFYQVYSQRDRETKKELHLVVIDLENAYNRTKGIMDLKEKKPISTKKLGQEKLEARQNLCQSPYGYINTNIQCSKISNSYR